MAYSFGAPKIVTNGLVLYLDAANRRSYPGSGTTWNDLSGNGNNGTLTNGPTFSGDNAGSMVFDGVDDYADLSVYSDVFDFGTGEFSIDSYINGSGTNNYRCIFWHHYNPGFSLITNITTGVPRFWLGNLVLNGNTNIIDNNWHHVVVTRKAETVKIYVDGNEDASSTSYLNRSATVNSATASVGRYSTFSSAYPFDGNIPVVKIYNRALSAEEVLQNYNATKARYNL